MKKSTQELVHELRNQSDIRKYIANNQQEFLDITFPDYLSQLLTEKNLKKADVIKASNLNLTYGYHIFAGLRNPERNKVIALAFGFGLDFEETQQLLTVAGVPLLYARNERDCLIIFSITHQQTIAECNELLFAQQQPIIE